MIKQKEKMDFVNLHNHTEYSLLSSISTVKDLFNKAKELNQTAIAITDSETLASAWSGYNLYKSTGIKFIIGTEVPFTDDANNKEEKLRTVVLIAKNAIGYRNLLSLNLEAFEQGVCSSKKRTPVCDWKLLEKYKEGLICLTGSGNGILAKDISSYNKEAVEFKILKLKEMFGDSLGLEIQTTNMKRNATFEHEAFDQNFLNRQLYTLGKKYNVRVVATTNSHYISKDQHETNDIFMAIGSGQNKFSNFRKKLSSPDFYPKSGEEVFNFFSRNYPKEDALEFVSNSVYFSDLCEKPDWIDPKFSNPTGKELPSFNPAMEQDYLDFKDWKEKHFPSLEEDKSYLRYKVAKGAEAFFLRENISEEKKKVYLDRLDIEYEVLEFHNLSSYMLIVSDYTNWAKNNGIAVGPGRGSVGGCLVAFFTGIHVADPIKYNLIFERFHNKEKFSFADIDQDFSTLRRHEVEQYIIKKYGSNNVAHVSNINTLTPKVYAKDLSRACEFGGDRQSAVDIGIEIADSITDKDVKNIDQAYDKCSLFAEYAKKYPEIILHKQICGKMRAWSTHAAGVIIGSRPLKGLVPLRMDKDGAIALEMAKDDAEANGLVKMDLLGLSTLDILEQTKELIRKSGKSVPKEIPLDDYKTYELISSGNNLGIFQLGTSGGTIELCKKIKPKNIEDVSHINSLARPSAKDIRNDFILTKEGKKPFSLMHENLRRAFGPTYGFGLYEESLFFLAQDVAGWSLQEADRLRKLTKEKGKNPQKAAQWRTEFIERSIKNNIPEDIATRIWDEIVVPFGGYGFNVSHSIMYSMVSYYTAFYKANYTVEFLLANLIQESNSNSPDADKNCLKYKNELRQLDIKILPPDINLSSFNYSISHNNELITGFKGLKDVGEDAINDIITKRPFKNFFDFMVRRDTSKVRSSTIKALAASGAFDCFDLNRRTIYLYCADYGKKLQVWLKKNDPSVSEFKYPFPKEKDFSLQEKFALETKYMGESFSCKPKVGYKELFVRSNNTVVNINKMKDKYPVDPFHCIIRDYFEFKIKKEDSKLFGRLMAKCTVEDSDGQTISLTIFPDALDKLKDITRKLSIEIEPGIGLKCTCVVNVYDGETGLICNDFYNVLPIPQPPSKQELADRKVSLRTPKTKDLNLSSIEDELINEGLIEEFE